MVTILRRSIFAAAMVAGLGAMPAMSATVLDESATGVWTSVNSPNTIGLAGVGTSNIRWGAPVTRGQKSGYSFSGITQSLSVQADTVFDIGVFTHLNRQIYQRRGRPSSITGASLMVSIAFALSDGVSRTISSVFDFAHWETTNNPGRGRACADGGRFGQGVNSAGCADRVVLDRNEGLSDSIEIDGVIYELDITGFLFNNTLLSSFWTVEGQENPARLQGILRTRTVPGDDTPPPPPIASVPLPAAGWMLLAGLGGLVSLRRFRRRA